MQVIFIGLNYPYDVLIAVETQPERYSLIKTEYGYTDIDKFEDNEHFDIIDLNQLPEDITSSFDWKNQFADRVGTIWIHKNLKA